ncbi:MAG: 23S rRNA (guanosine(2251)-2'-O)-methyltransferase RlmB [Burkholderiaceae bacterium]
MDPVLIYGFHAVLARLKRDAAGVRDLYVDAGREDARMRDLVKAANEAGLRPHFVDGSRIEKLCPRKRHQGVVAMVEFSAPALSLDDLLDSISAPVTLLLLDGVTDPRNLGACLRVADGAGAAAVIAPKDHACQLTEAAIQTASGAAESVPYIMVTNLARTMDTLRERDIWLVGADDSAPHSLYEASLPTSIGWVLGAEGTGMRRLTRERCDLLVRIPMSGQVSSLNVSVAAGVVLYESLRRRGLPKAE